MNVFELHLEVFGVYPVVIGANWEDVPDRILSAIEAGVPYDETKELDKDLLDAFNSGEIVF